MSLAPLSGSAAPPVDYAYEAVLPPNLPANYTRLEEVQTLDDTLLYRVYTATSVSAKLYRWNDSTGFSELAVGPLPGVLAFEPSGMQKVYGTIWLYGNARFQSGPDGLVLVRPAFAGGVYVKRLFPSHLAGVYVPGAVGSVDTPSIKFVSAVGRIYGDVYFNSRRVPWVSFTGDDGTAKAQLKTGITIPPAFSAVLGTSGTKLLGNRMTLNLYALYAATATSPANPFASYSSDTSLYFSHCSDAGHLVGKTTSWVTMAPNSAIVPLGLPFSSSSIVSAVDWPVGTTALSLAGSHAAPASGSPSPFWSYNGQSYTSPALPATPSWGKALRGAMVPQIVEGGTPGQQSLTPKFFVEGFLQHPGSIPCKYFLVRDYTASGGSLAYLGIEERTQCSLGTIVAVKPRFPLHGATTSQSFVATVEAPGGKLIDVVLAGKTDSNADGMPDAWVAHHGISGGPNEDFDGDSLTNLQEFRYGTVPFNPDSDEDGIPDGLEVQNGMGALNVGDASEDWDGDHVSNIDEINLELSSLGEFQLYTDQDFSSGTSLYLQGANRAGQLLFNTANTFEISNFTNVQGVPYVSRTLLPSTGGHGSWIEPEGIDDQGNVYGAFLDFLPEQFNNYGSDFPRLFSVRPENGDFTWNRWDDFSLGLWDPGYTEYLSWLPGAGYNWQIFGPASGGQFHTRRDSWIDSWNYYPGMIADYGVVGPGGWSSQIQWNTSQMDVQKIVVGADGSAALIWYEQGSGGQMHVTFLSPEGQMLATYSPPGFGTADYPNMVKIAGTEALLRLSLTGGLTEVQDAEYERPLVTRPPTGIRYELISSAVNGQILIHPQFPGSAGLSGLANISGTGSYLIRDGYTVALRAIAAQSGLNPARWRQTGTVVASTSGDIGAIYWDRFSDIPWLCYFKNNRDTDNDGLPDDWERFHFGNLLFNGDQDSDGDGKTNLQEFMASTRPRVPAARDVSDPDQPAAAAADTAPRIFLMKSKRWAKYKHERRIEPGQQDYPSDSGSSSSYDASNGLYYGLPCRPGKGELVIFKNFPNGQNSRAYENRYLTNRIPFINMTSDPCDNSYLGIGTVLQNNAMFPEEPTEYMEMLGEEIPLNQEDHVLGNSKSTYREEIYYDYSGGTPIEKTRVIINWEADMEQARYWLCSNSPVTEEISHTVHFLVTRTGTEVTSSQDVVSQTLIIPSGSTYSTHLDVQPNFYPSGVKGADFTKDYSANKQITSKNEEYEIAPITADLDVNTDRTFDSGNTVIPTTETITPEDERNEDEWSHERGSVFHVNYDLDGGSPDGGFDAITYNDQQVPIKENWAIENNADQLDLSYIEVTSVNGLTPDTRLFLRLENPAEAGAFHLYNVDRSESAPAFAPIWGGRLADSAPSGVEFGAEVDVTRFLNSQSSEYVETRPNASGPYQFAMEGLIYPGMKLNADDTFDGRVKIFIAIGLPDGNRGELDAVMLGMPVQEYDPEERAKAPKNAAGNYGSQAAVPYDDITSGAVKLQPAFPGAEGFGKWSAGGRFGAVLAVTKNTDDGSVGTLRWALEQNVPRTVLVRLPSGTDGTITLSKPLTVNRGHLSFFGQSAFGAGICTKGYTFETEADHLVFRHFRSRPGEPLSGKETDAISVKGGDHVIWDHCSASWSTDEVFSVDRAGRVTIQWCFITESLRHSNHPKSPHGYASLLRGTWNQLKSRYSYHHNFVAHHQRRMPRPGNNISPTVDFTGPILDIRNNVFYNWEGTYGGYNDDNYKAGTPPDWDGKCRYNFVKNYYSPGPQSTEEGYFYFKESAPQARAYRNENTHRGTVQERLSYAPGPSSPGAIGSVPLAAYLQAQPFDYESLTEHVANAAMANLIYTGKGQYKGAGASFWRDSRDSFVATNVGKIIDAAIQPAWPTLPNSEPAQDTDSDGIPDAWESQNGLNPNDGKDANMHVAGYSHLEQYLSSLLPEIPAQDDPTQ